MSPEAYQEKIEGLLSKVPGNSPDRFTLHDLIRELGCPGVRFYGKRWNVDSPPAPPAQNSDIVERALTIALQWYLEGAYRSDQDTLSILTGLASDRRWRRCLTTVDGAYNLVTLLYMFSLMTTPSYPMPATARALFQNVEPMVRDLLNAWVAPETLLTHAPGPDLLLRAMFGDAWCDIFADSQTISKDIANLIESQRPPFQKYLVPAQCQSDAITLPTMDHL